MKKGYLLALGISVCLIILIIITIRTYFAPKGINIDKEKYPITGIDVSRHSGIIDWNKIENQDISFVYIKATEGEDYLDPNYLSNVTAARKTNLMVGDYHFFRFNKPGKTQAVNFLSHTRNFIGKLTPALDVEEWGNMPVIKSETQIRKEIASFLNTVEKANGCKMIIYTNVNSYNRYIKGQFPDNPIWICSFNKNRILPDKREWLFWQHAHNGKLAGIKGFVDINTFNGDEIKWKKYIDQEVNCVMDKDFKLKIYHSLKSFWD
ncbi:MAG: GH25 family lysozyme [Bacteroidota bacterium]|nr:GH25 family lysozyme [Bacteroidota bacterium]